MKTISIKQPWSCLICHGVKDIENRTWQTKFRGRVLVHASAKSDSRSHSINNIFTPEQWEKMRITGGSNLLWNMIKSNWELSAIIGSVEIVDCVQNHESIWAEKSFVDVNKKGDEKVIEIYNWVLANPVLFAEPILNVKGKLSFWEYPMTEEEYLNRLKIGNPLSNELKNQVEENNQYWRNGGHNGPTGHGDICYSDADPGL